MGDSWVSHFIVECLQQYLVTSPTSTQHRRDHEPYWGSRVSPLSGGPHVPLEKTYSFCMSFRVLSPYCLSIVYQGWSLDHLDSIHWQHAQKCVISSESRGPPVPLESSHHTVASTSLPIVLYMPQICCFVFFYKLGYLIYLIFYLHDNSLNKFIFKKMSDVLIYLYIIYISYRYIPTYHAFHWRIGNWWSVTMEIWIHMEVFSKKSVMFPSALGDFFKNTVHFFTQRTSTLTTRSKITLHEIAGYSAY